ncbi:MAG: tetratricopeptide repeat protein, partial [Verrucomicrobiales bacterium]
GKYAEARTHLENAVKLEPDFSEAHNNLGTVFAATGELEKALHHFNEAVRADPTNEGAVSRIKQVERMQREQRNSRKAPSVP